MKFNLTLLFMFSLIISYSQREIESEKTRPEFLFEYAVPATEMSTIVNKVKGLLGEPIWTDNEIVWDGKGSGKNYLVVMTSDCLSITYTESAVEPRPRSDIDVLVSTFSFN